MTFLGQQILFYKPSEAIVCVWTSQAGCRGRLPESVVTICSLQQATSEEVKCYSTTGANGSFMFDVSSFQVIPL